MIWYWIILGIGVVTLIVVALFHQSILPLERGLIQPEWTITDKHIPEGPDRVEVAGEEVICTCRDGTEQSFRAPGMRLALGALAFVTVHNQRLLAVLDRGRQRRTYLVDIARAAAKGDLLAGAVGYWRHGTGRLLAADGEHLIEVHRCLGRDRIYLLDASRAMQGHAFGMGIERTLIAPTISLGAAALRGRKIIVSTGPRIWKTELH